MNLKEDLSRLVKPGRRPVGIAAALLPFDNIGQIDEEAFARHLQATQAAGLANAVNMDTGYVNLLTQEENQRVLRLTSEALGPGVRFIAGAFIEGLDGELVTLYRAEIDRIL